MRSPLERARRGYRWRWIDPRYWIVVALAYRAGGDRVDVDHLYHAYGLITPCRCARCRRG